MAERVFQEQTTSYKKESKAHARKKEQGWFGWRVKHVHTIPKHLMAVS